MFNWLNLWWNNQSLTGLARNAPNNIKEIFSNPNILLEKPITEQQLNIVIKSLKPIPPKSVHYTVTKPNNPIEELNMLFSSGKHKVY